MTAAAGLTGRDYETLEVPQLDECRARQAPGGGSSVN